MTGLGNSFAFNFCIRNSFPIATHLVVVVLVLVGRRSSCYLSFLPRDALVHSAVLRFHVVRLSVRPSVCNVGGSGSHSGNLGN